MNENSKPLDERKPGKTEVRGGDKPADYTPTWYENNGFPPGTFDDDELEDDEA